MQKQFVSIGSYVEESQIGRHKVFIVANDIDRDPKLGDKAFTDLFAQKVIIDGVERQVRDIRDSRRGHGGRNYKQGEPIGLEVMN